MVRVRQQAKKEKHELHELGVPVAQFKNLERPLVFGHDHTPLKPASFCMRRARSAPLHSEAPVRRKVDPAIAVAPVRSDDTVAKSHTPGLRFIPQGLTAALLIEKRAEEGKCAISHLWRQRLRDRGELGCDLLVAGRGHRGLWKRGVIPA